MAPLFGLRQLGVGIRGGCEAAIYSACHYLQSLLPDHIMVKLDFANAFNSLHRSDMLLSIRDCLPKLYALLTSLTCYIKRILGLDTALCSYSVICNLLTELTYATVQETIDDII